MEAKFHFAANPELGGHGSYQVLPGLEKKGGQIIKNPKRCTDKLDKALKYIDEYIYGNECVKLAKQITRDVFSFGEYSQRHSFSIQCYVTRIPDIRFCIDRGSDCIKLRTMTNFLCIIPPCEIHVIDWGKPYLHPQSTTKFNII